MRPRQLTVCLLGGLALAVSGCGGSSAKKSTTSTVASAPTGSTAQATTPSSSGGSTAPKGGATAPSGGSTGPSGGRAGKQTPAETAAKAAEARLLRKKQAAERQIAQIRARYRSEGAAQKKAQLEAARRAARKKRKPYPQYLQAKFTATCEAAEGSPSQCACILSKQEFSSGEVALALGELLALEQALKATTIQEVARPLPPHQPVVLPGGVRIHLEECLGGR